ncbi:MAG: DUF1116 domain-containing protein [Egibacteraceae bacterium]
MLGESLRVQGVEVVDVDWRIPAGGDPALVGALTRLYGPRAAAIEAANREVLTRLDKGAPVVVGVAPAHRVVPGMDERTVLHPGPGLPWEEFCDPLRRSVRAAVIAEGWAADPDGAEACVSGGEVRLEPANWHAAAVPMATALGPTAPVWVIEHPQGGNRAFSGINQGPGKAPWFGVETPEAVDRLVWLREEAGPVLDAALQGSGPVDVFRIAAQGLQMGDDVHMRVQAATNHLIRHLLPHLAGQDDPRRVAVARFLSANHLFFLNLAMAAAKAIADWAATVSGSSIVIGMARNGTTFGIRLAGMPDRWFVAPAPEVGQALYHPGFGPDDAAGDIGDSAVLELVGLGGPAAAASPAVAGFLGRGVDEAIATTEDMERICAGSSTRFQIPYLEFRGTPLGVDVRKVVELELTPHINTGILHARDGTGQVGAGIAEAPLACFQEALLALDATGT